MGSRPGRLATGRRADRFLQKGSLRSCRLSLQPGRAVAEIWLRGLIRRARRLHQARLQRHRLAAESLTASNKCGWEDIMAKFDLNDDGVVVIVGSGAGTDNYDYAIIVQIEFRHDVLPTAFVRSRQTFGSQSMSLKPRLMSPPCSA